MQKKGDFSTLGFPLSTFFCTFAPEMAHDMRKFLFFILISVSCLCAHAETLLLRTGARVRGGIVFQNDEVVIIRNAEGARFQYPRAEVEQILANDPEAEEAPNEQKEDDITVSKKASILLEIAGGFTSVSRENVGGAFSADILVGTHHIGDRHIFAGGGLGYHGIYLINPFTMSANNVFEKYNFLPIQAALRMPFTEKKHAPAFGLSLGYGVALSKEYKGGVYAGMDFGYRCQVNPKTAIGVMFYVQYQQVTKQVTNNIEGNEFTNYAGRNIVTFGTKFSFYF